MFSFHLVDTRSQTQDFRLGSNYLYLLSHPSDPPHPFLDLFFLMFECLASMCGHHMCAWFPRGQKKALNPLKLELYVVVSQYVAIEN